MLEKILGERNSIQRRIVIEFIIIIVLVAVLSSIGAYLFINKGASEIIKINVENYEELREVLKIIRKGLLIILLNTILVSSVIIRIASKNMLEPLEKMIKATQEIANGNFDVRLETKRKDEIEKLVSNFNKMVKQLEVTETLQKDFIDNVSHEIKTPISSIQGFAQLLKEENLSIEEKKEYVRNYYRRI